MDSAKPAAAKSEAVAQSNIDSRAKVHSAPPVAKSEAFAESDIDSLFDDWPFDDKSLS